MSEVKHKHLKVEEHVHQKVKLAALLKKKTISQVIDEYFEEYDKLITED